jgi:hypothetical protein
MSMKRWMSVALVLAVAFGGCKKKEESQPQPVAAPEQPAQPTTPTTDPAAPQPTEPGGTAEPAAVPATPATPAVSEATSEKTLEALDDSIEKLAGGFGGALGGFSMGKRMADEGMGESDVQEGPEEPMPISRMQVHFDLAGLRTSPLGPMLEGMLGMLQASGEVPANQACMIELLGKLETAFIDLQFNEAGDEPKSMVVAVKTTAAKDEMVACMRTAVQEGHEFAELPVAGGTGYTIKETGEEPEMVMYEATPGNWLMGPQPSVEAALQADPAADPGFQTLTGPLGPSILRMTIVPSPAFAALASEIEGDAPAEAQCVKGLFTSFKGGSMGVRLTPDFTLSLAMQNGSSAEAAAAQACVSGLWEMLKPAIIAEAGEEAGAQLQAMFGMTLQDLLSRVQIAAQAEFTTVSISLPAEVLGKMVELAAALGGMM